MAITLNGTTGAVTGIVSASSSDLSTALATKSATAWGKVSLATVNTPQSITSASLVDITNLSTTFNAVSGRQYKATLNIPQVYGTANERAQFAILSGSTQIGRLYFQIIGSYGVSLTYNSLFTASGSTTIKVQACRDIGSNALNIWTDSAAGCSAVLLIEDIGAA